MSGRTRAPRNAAPPESPPGAEPWTELISLLERIERVLHALELHLRDSEPIGPRAEPPDPDALAYRFRRGELETIAHPDTYPLSGLLGVERSVDRLRANVDAFCRGAPCLDMLLYGDRGTGKSSALRGLLNEFAPSGLRLIETGPADLVDLGALFALLRVRSERFLVICDDLSFDDGDPAMQRLKAALEGGIEARPDNALIAVTSNRRHLVTEHADDNRVTRRDRGGELHLGESVHEKISLSDRFGLSLPFLGFDQDTYLAIVRHHARDVGLDVPEGQLHAHALRFALERGGRSGRTARHACITLLQSARLLSARVGDVPQGRPPGR